MAERSDKSGVKPQVINLPTGPGSVQGLGESFQPQLNTGTAGYRVPIAVPPGVGGHTPSLSLVYDAGRGNGPFGLGWRLELPYIQRQTNKGLPSYGDQDRFVHGSGEELVPLPDETYRFKVEGSFTRFRRVPGGAWEGTERNGTRWLFGETADARQANAMGTFLWQPQRSIDPDGNEIRFYYKQDGGQVYLSEIRYNADRSSSYGAEPPDGFVGVRIAYGPRPDPLDDYRSRFRVRTGWRAQAIDVVSLGKLVRRYELGYEDTEGMSLLNEVRQLGTDLARFESNPAGALPPLTLGYTHFDPGRAANVSMIQPPPVQVGTPNVDLVDINGDGLPSLVVTDPVAGHQFYVNRGRGRWDPEPVFPGASPPDRLETVGVQIADMDGTGRAGLLVKTGPGSSTPFYYYPNPGTGTWDLRSRIDLGFNPPFTFEDPDVRLVDLDNDGRIDVLRTTASAYYVYFNRPGGWSGGPDRIVPPVTYGTPLLLTDPRVHLADMNGDGLQDLVLVTDERVVYFPSKGLGDFDAPIVMANSPAFHGRAAEVLLADVDGNGLADLVLVDRTHVRIWRNLAGTGFAPEVVISNVPEYVAGKTTLRLADMKGSGKSGLLYSTSPAIAEDKFRYLDFTGGTLPHLLERIDNGLGRIIALSYRTSTDYYVDDWEAGQPWTLRSPVPVPVVSRSVVQDALSGQAYTSEYRYRNAYYDSSERAFRGFALAEQRDLGDDSAPTRIERVVFDTGATDLSRKGMVLQQDALGANGTCGQDAPAAAESAGTAHLVGSDAPSACYRRTLNRLETRKLTDGRDGRSISLSTIAQTDVLDYETTATPRRKQQQFAYDDYGNLIQQFDYGEVAPDGTDPGLGGDEHLTFFTYASNVAAWILDRVSAVRETDLVGNIVAEQRRYYDGAAFVGLPLGDITRGDLTRQEDNLGPASGNRWVQSKRYSYDVYGNRIEIMDADGTLDANGQAVGGHWTAITFDSVSHLYPVMEAIHVAEGQALTLTAEYHPSFGVITRAVDFNEQETRFRYDALGRLVAIVRPGDSDVLPTQTFNYLPGAAVSAVGTETREQSGTADVRRSIAYVDGLGRQVQTRSDGQDGEVVVSGAATFNLRMTEREKRLPYFAATRSLNFAPPERGAPKIVTDYDPVGRVVRTTNPGGTYAMIAYQPWQTVAADEENTDPGSPHANATALNRYDGLGRLVHTVENDGSEHYLTSYVYDPRGNLVLVSDARGNARSQAFDGLGRKVVMDDPDRGTTTFSYDDVGNVQSTLDAKGQQVRYAYDGANRVTSRDADGVASVRYHYDSDQAPEYPDGHNTRARLAWVEDGSGREYFSYDPRGTEAARIKRIDSTEEGRTPFDFVFRTRYDAMDRLTETTYPDGMILTYQYNRQGLLDAIPGFISKISYTGSGQRSALTTSDAVRTTYQYDDRLRLRATRSTGGTGAVLQDLRYRLDGVGNLLAVDDGRPDRTAADDDSRTFSYDDLYRLTGVRYLAGQQYAIAYAHDPLGNLVHQSSDRAAANLGDLQYGQQAGPHALTGIANQTWTYDSNGNLVAKPGFTYAWDSHDRLVSVTGPADLKADHVYDHSGVRVSKRVSTPSGLQTVLYPDPSAEVREDVLVKYVLVDGERVAELRTSMHPDQLIRGFDSGTQALPSPDLETQGVRLAPSDTVVGSGADQILFYHPDHLGSSTVVVDSNGELAERVAYEPYGVERTRTGDRGVLHRFIGQEQDPDTGLYFFGARLCDPVVGRFISVDPLWSRNPERGLGRPQTFNGYAYAQNSPLSYRDRSGLCPTCISAGVGAVAGAGFVYGLQVAANLTVNGFSAQAFTDVDFKAVGAGAAAGFVGGATLGLGTAVFGTGAAATVGSGAASGVLAGQSGRATENLLGGQPVTTGLGRPRDMALDALIGGVISGLGSRLRGQGIETPRGLAVQANSAEAMSLRSQVAGGTSIFRGGSWAKETLAGEGRYWALESPLNPGMAQRSGAATLGSGPPDWAIKGAVKPNADFIVRSSPPVGPNPGGAPEVVTRPGTGHGRGDVTIEYFHMPDK